MRQTLSSHDLALIDLAYRDYWTLSKHWRAPESSKYITVSTALKVLRNIADFGFIAFEKHRLCSDHKNLRANAQKLLIEIVYGNEDNKAGITIKNPVGY